MKPIPTRPLFVPAASLLALLAACSSTDEVQPQAGYALPRSRIELSSTTLDYDGSAHDGAVVTLSDRALQETGAQVLPQEAEDFLPGFLRESETSLVARWTGEGFLVHPSPEQRRVLRLRRILSFETEEMARGCFPRLAEGELLQAETGRAEVLASELAFSLARSRDGGAFRVRLDRVFARRAELPLSQLLPVEEPLPVILSLTLRYVDAGQEHSHTILFGESLDVTQGDFEVGGKISDWIAVAPGSHPHSIQVSVVGREELDAFTKTLRDTGLTLFDLANTVKGVGIL